MNPFLVVIGLSVMGVVRDYFIELSGRSPVFMDLRIFSMGFVVYMLTVPGWFFVMKHLSLSALGAVYAISTVLLLVIVIMD